jgi:hypothetical protein
MSRNHLKEVTRHRAKPRGAPDDAERVRVMYGVHSLDVLVAGRMVASVREALAQPFNISPQAVALVNGQEVDETHVLSPGEVLEFVRYAGEKGTRTTNDPRGGSRIIRAG